MLGEGMGGGGVTGAAGCAVLLCYLKPRGPMILGAGMGGGGGFGAWVSAQVYTVELQASTGCRRARLT